MIYKEALISYKRTDNIEEYSNTPVNRQTSIKEFIFKKDNIYKVDIRGGSKRLYTSCSKSKDDSITKSMQTFRIYFSELERGDLKQNIVSLFDDLPMFPYLQVRENVLFYDPTPVSRFGLAYNNIFNISIDEMRYFNMHLNKKDTAISHDNLDIYDYSPYGWALYKYEGWKFHIKDDKIIFDVALKKDLDYRNFNIYISQYDESSKSYQYLTIFSNSEDLSVPIRFLKGNLAIRDVDYVLIQLDRDTLVGSKLYKKGSWVIVNKTTSVLEVKNKSGIYYIYPLGIKVFDYMPETVIKKNHIRLELHTINTDYDGEVLFKIAKTGEYTYIGGNYLLTKKGYKQIDNLLFKLGPTPVKDNNIISYGDLQFINVDNIVYVKHKQDTEFIRAKIVDKEIYLDNKKIDGVSLAFLKQKDLLNKHPDFIYDKNYIVENGELKECISNGLYVYGFNEHNICKSCKNLVKKENIIFPSYKITRPEKTYSTHIKFKDADEKTFVVGQNSGLFTATTDESYQKIEGISFIDADKILNLDINVYEEMLGKKAKELEEIKVICESVVTNKGRYNIIIYINNEMQELLKEPEICNRALVSKYLHNQDYNFNYQKVFLLGNDLMFKKRDVIIVDYRRIDTLEAYKNFYVIPAPIVDNVGLRLTGEASTSYVIEYIDKAIAFSNIAKKKVVKLPIGIALFLDPNRIFRERIEESIIRDKNKIEIIYNLGKLKVTCVTLLSDNNISSEVKVIYDEETIQQIKFSHLSCLEGFIRNNFKEVKKLYSKSEFSKDEKDIVLVSPEHFYNYMYKLGYKNLVIAAIDEETTGIVDDSKLSIELLKEEGIKGKRIVAKYNGNKYPVINAVAALGAKYHNQPYPKYGDFYIKIYGTFYMENRYADSNFTKYVFDSIKHSAVCTKITVNNIVAGTQIPYRPNRFTIDTRVLKYFGNTIMLPKKMKTEAFINIGPKNKLSTNIPFVERDFVYKQINGFVYEDYSTPEKEYIKFYRVEGDRVFNREIEIDIKEQSEWFDYYYNNAKAQLKLDVREDTVYKNLDASFIKIRFDTTILEKNDVIEDIIWVVPTDFRCDEHTHECEINKVKCFDSSLEPFKKEFRGKDEIFRYCSGYVYFVDETNEKPCVIEIDNTNYMNNRGVVYNWDDIEGVFKKRMCLLEDKIKDYIEDETHVYNLTDKENQ